MRVPFVKTQSIGNDFVLVHDHEVARLYASIREVEPAKVLVGSGVALKGRLTVENFDALLSRLAIVMSHRRLGVGSDGLLMLGKKGDGIVMRMFNPDGTEDFCGNGLRCAAICAAEEGLVSSTHFPIEHGGIQVSAELLGGNRVRTILGKADYTPSNVPVTSGRELFRETVWSGMVGGMPQSFFGSALTTGSTHVVIPTATLPDDESFRSISAAIETDSKFPQRTSVIWVREVEPSILEIRIWERGAGETLGCGTGSAAAAADYMRRRNLSGTIEVRNRGGTVKVTMPAWNAPIDVEGPAQLVYSGVFNLPENWENPVEGT